MNFTLLAEHVQKAHSLNAEARQQYLDSLPADVAEQVEELLRFERATLDLSQTPALELALEVLAEPQPQRVGRWEVLQLIGRGGMASVYRVERSEGAIRQVAACKIGYARAELEDGLRRETTTLLDLGHPGIAHVLDFGHTASGRPYLVSELVEGTDVVSFVNEKHMSLAARLVLFEEVLSAIAYAHERLLMHQDIKPDNILVDASGHPRLIDFGLATVLSGTGDSPVLGYTQRYASPEQIRGERLGLRSDIYSLGVTLAEALKGVIGERRHEDIRAVIAKATRDDPQERYPSAAAMAADLRAVRESRPVAARTGGALYRMTRFVQRHPLPMALAGLALLATSAGLIATLAQAREALAASERAEAERQRATATSDFLIGIFEAVTPSQGGQVEIKLSEFLAPAMERLRSDVSLSVEGRIDIARALAAAFDGIADYAEAERSLQYGIEVARNGGLRKQEAELLLARADLYLKRQELVLGAPLLAEAADAAKAFPEIALKVDFSRMNVAMMGESWPELLTLADGQLARLEQMGEPQHRREPTVRYYRTVALMRLSRAEEALQEADRTRQSYLRYFDEDSEPIVNVIDIKMQSAMAAANWPLADSLAVELLEKAEKVLGGSHPGLGEKLSNVGLLRQMQGRADAAAELYAKAYAIVSAAQGAANPRTLMMQLNLGSALGEVKHYDESIFHLRSAVEGLQQAVGSRHPLLAKGKMQLAAALALSGTNEGVEQLIDDAIDIFNSEPAYVYDHADALGVMASIRAEQGRFADCEQAADEAISIISGGSLAASGFPEVYRAYRAYCRLAQGKDDGGELQQAAAALSSKTDAGNPDLTHVRELQDRATRLAK